MEKKEESKPEKEPIEDIIASLPEPAKALGVQTRQLLQDTEHTDKQNTLVKFRVKGIYTRDFRKHKNRKSHIRRFQYASYNFSVERLQIGKKYSPNLDIF